MLLHYILLLNSSWFFWFIVHFSNAAVQIPATKSRAMDQGFVRWGLHAADDVYHAAVPV